MEVQTTTKLALVYIGEDQHFAHAFYEHEGITLTVFKNAYDASLALPNLGNINAIVCENKLPGQSGIAFYNSFFKPTHQQKNTSFILISDDFVPKTVEQALADGIDDCYNKPVAIDRLLNRIQFLKDLKKKFAELHIDGSDSKPTATYKPRFFKRSFDIVFASLALLALSPLLLIFAIAIRLESKGKVYYISKRVGSGYKIFNFYKLRSMYPDADQRLKEFLHLNQYSGTDATQENKERVHETAALSSINDVMLISDDAAISETVYIQSKMEENASAFIKFDNDPRITKVGKIIRKLSIDELPQLINVIKGDMSIVGNRPLPLYEAELLTTDEWTQRFNGPAGITGLWQVEARGRTSKMSPQERKELDNKYVEYARGKFAFWKDMWIIIRTFRAVFQKENV
ncbi:sugar transferase [Zhouia sp. PK063]|uniref:sugar transferase n=1 Tax=Zhouia sp. PK063 TaxID=3373602 RepID=UPI0037AB1D29